ncbi:MAG: ABC transporter permease [Oscillospiraceae bacterium]|nr:ABC transporter permease [Oscillospiraceae bacterium]
MTVKNKTGVKSITQKYTMKQMQPVLLLLILIVVSLIFTGFNKNFMSWQNWSSILLTACTVGIISIGQGVCKMADYFDLSVGMVASLGGLLVAFLLQAGVPLLIAVLIAIIMGAVCGLLAGVLVAYLKMNSFITTFALQSAYRGIIYIFTDGFPISMTMKECFVPLTSFCQKTFFGSVQTSVIAMIVLYVVVHLFLTYTKLGRSIFLVGGNQKCAHICGINVIAVQISIFILCDILAVLSGILYAGRMGTATAFLGATIPMESIAVAILGGTVAGHGNMLQTFLAVLIIFVVKNGLIMMGIPDFYQYIAVGLIMFIAVMVQVEHKGR